MSTATRFVVLFEGRTGSSFLISSLGSHPRIHVNDEILVDRDAAAQRALVNDWYLADRPPHVQAVGFKTKLRNIKDVPAFTQQLDSLNIRVIHLIRTNKVKLAVSRLNGRRLHAMTGRWNRDAAGPDLPPFAPTLAEFDQALRFRVDREDALDAYIAALRRPVLTVRYEDLLAAPPATFARIFDFIRVTPAPLTSAVVKITDDNLRTALLNYDELRSHYRGTEYEAMFE